MNPLTVDPARLQRLRDLCLRLPQATEKITWGDPTWRVRDKIFAMQKGNYEAGRPSLWLKAPDGAQSALVQAQPQRFFVPPYVGHKGWVGVYLDTRSIDWPLIESLIEESYRLIAPKQLASMAGTSARSKGDAVAARNGAAGKKAGRKKPAQEQIGKKAAARGAQKQVTARTRQATAKNDAAPKVTALSRPRHPMPAFVKRALSERGLSAAYKARPYYQQNDYIGWIRDAKQESTQQRRLQQMLEELAGGTRYMKMKWSGSSPA
jgi:predicted DNA-binding protein (MmcQ/YjbR family)